MYRDLVVDRLCNHNHDVISAIVENSTDQDVNTIFDTNIVSINEYFAYVKDGVPYYRYTDTTGKTRIEPPMSSDFIMDIRNFDSKYGSKNNKYDYSLDAVKKLVADLEGREYLDIADENRDILGTKVRTISFYIGRYNELYNRVFRVHNLKEYNGDGEDLTGEKKSCEILLPISIYANKEKRKFEYVNNDEFRVFTTMNKRIPTYNFEYFDKEKSYFSPDEFSSKTKFIRVILTHVHNDDTIYTGIQIPTRKDRSHIFTVGTNYKTGKQVFADSSANPNILKKYLTKDEMEALMVFIADFARQYHMYPTPECIRLIKLHAYNTRANDKMVPYHTQVAFLKNKENRNTLYPLQKYTRKRAREYPRYSPDALYRLHPLDI